MCLTNELDQEEDVFREEIGGLGPVTEDHIRFRLRFTTCVFRVG